MRPYLVGGDKARFIDTRIWFYVAILCSIPVCVVNQFIQIGNKASQVSFDATKEFVQTDTVGIVLTAKSNLDMTAFPPTGTPTVTPSPTVTPVPVGVGLYPVMTFKLSFYDPAIGKYFPEIASVNCLDWSIELQDCLSKVNKGTEHYFVYYRRGVACPPPLHIGQRFRVVSPIELRNISTEWLCIDRGGAIHDYWMDFMLKYPDDIWTGDNLDNFPWGSDVVVEILP